MAGFGSYSHDERTLMFGRLLSGYITDKSVDELYECIYSSAPNITITDLCYILPSFFTSSIEKKFDYNILLDKIKEKQPENEKYVEICRLNTIRMTEGTYGEKARKQIEYLISKNYDDTYEVATVILDFELNKDNIDYKKVCKIVEQIERLKNEE